MFVLHWNDVDCAAGARTRAGKWPKHLCITVRAYMLQVTLVAVFQTVLYNTPLIFLREAEVSEGQMDVILTPGEFSANYAVNYTLLSQLALVGGNNVRQNCMLFYYIILFVTTLCSSPFLRLVMSCQRSFRLPSAARCAVCLVFACVCPSSVVSWCSMFAGI